MLISSYITTVFITDVRLALRGGTYIFEDFRYMYFRHARTEPINF